MADYIDMEDEEFNDILLAIVEENDVDLLTKQQFFDLIAKVLRIHKSPADGL